MSYCQYNSFTYFVYQQFRAAFNSEPLGVKHSVKAYEEDFWSLERIIKNYPKMSLILVPQRDEVGLFGRENIDTQIVKKLLISKGISFNYCDLNGDDYMPIDGHPNATGYSKIFACLKDAITG